MFATWILFIFIMLVIPYLTFEAGFLRLKKCASMDAERGYRSKLSQSSPEAWAYAQKACTVRYMAAGIIMAVVSLAIASSMTLETPARLAIFSGVIVLFQAVTVVCLIATVEQGLRKRFGDKVSA